MPGLKGLYGLDKCVRLFEGTNARLPMRMLPMVRLLLRFNSSRDSTDSISKMPSESWPLGNSAPCRRWWSSPGTRSTSTPSGQSSWAHTDYSLKPVNMGRSVSSASAPAVSPACTARRSRGRQRHTCLFPCCDHRQQPAHATDLRFVDCLFTTSALSVASRRRRFGGSQAWHRHNVWPPGSCGSPGACAAAFPGASPPLRRHRPHRAAGVEAYLEGPEQTISGKGLPVTPRTSLRWNTADPAPKTATSPASGRPSPPW